MAWKWAFWSTFVLLYGVLSLVQDWMGLEAWQQWERDHWMTPPWWAWIPVVLLGIAGLVGASWAEKRAGLKAKFADEIMEAARKDGRTIVTLQQVGDVPVGIEVKHQPEKIPENERVH